MRAKSNASVDLTFDRRVTVDPWRLVAKGGRQYAGFYLEPLQGGLHVGIGALYLRAFDATDMAPLEAAGFEPFEAMPPLPLAAPRPLDKNPAGDDLPVEGEKRVLPPGRYRLHVLADGPVEIRIPVRGFNSGSLRARGSSRVSFAQEDITPYPAGITAPGATTAELGLDIARRRNITVVAIQSIRHGTLAAEVWPTSGCVGPPGDPSCLVEPAEEGEFGSTYTQSQITFEPTTRVGQRLDEIIHYYIPGQTAPGPTAAHFFASSTNVMDRVVVAAMSISM